MKTTTANQKKLVRKNRGQGMTEYIIIVALIAIAAVGIITIFGNNIRQLFGASVDILGGATTASASLTSQQTHAQARGLSNFAKE